MRTGNSDRDQIRTRTGRNGGRAVLVGLGLDDAEGHMRYTHSRDCELVGGSEATHAAMWIKAIRIKAELDRRGYSLDSITRDQMDDVRRIVERVSGE